MKFLIIGLGSMGKRRIRNLQSLKFGDIIGFDVSKERRKESEDKYKIKTFESIGDAINENPNAIIISSPFSTTSLNPSDIRFNSIKKGIFFSMAMFAY
jgi:predicted dehydrogenase